MCKKWDAFHFIEFQMLPHEVDELMQVDDEMKKAWLKDFGFEFSEEKPDPDAFCEAINYLAMNGGIGNGDIWDNDYYEITDFAKVLLADTPQVSIRFVEV
jgi:hypothetical protein